ncbi:hypothetical protein B0H11DRAFT_2230072 [Mycena galericulata]|nr:hypothetical protein B0H11DRAFT_2230072 [Mycena galericulata]
MVDWQSPEDLLATNFQNLPGNYLVKFRLYHALTWPQISLVAEDQICAFPPSSIDILSLNHFFCSDEGDDDNAQRQIPKKEVYGHVN